MIEGLDLLFEPIGKSIQDAIPDDWLIAWIDVVFYSEHARFWGEYLPSSGPPSKSFTTTRECRAAFEGIRQKFKDAGKALWCRAHFELQANGKFDMKWGYDGCDAAGFAKFDEEVELRRLRAKLGN
jgi:hypothetical protein